MTLIMVGVAVGIVVGIGLTVLSAAWWRSAQQSKLENLRWMESELNRKVRAAEVR